MALPHAQALDVIDIRPLGDRWRDTVTTRVTVPFPNPDPDPDRRA